ncbi:MAG: hypothetical protein HY377_01425 [Candidatus Blackburnbacteria bacterium]|nr:hypothetical protein [Candidatus Blackburnbacteria bacterium]
MSITLEAQDLFFIAFLITILITRIFLYFVPAHSRIYTDKTHHLYVGSILLVISLIFLEGVTGVITSAIAIGFIVDEIWLIPYLFGFLHGGRRKIYWSISSLSVVLLGAIAVFFWRYYLASI